MTTKQLKQAIAEAAVAIPDEAPEEMLREILDFLHALQSADKEKLGRFSQFFKNIEEDSALLHRLAQ